jgi:hypothetical protein
MPTFLSSAVWRPRSRSLLRLGSLHPTPIDRVLGVFFRESGEGEIELDFREGVLTVVYHGIGFSPLSFIFFASSCRTIFGMSPSRVANAKSSYRYLSPAILICVVR